MIAWNAAGISPAVGSALWSESVAAEVIVFVAVGPFLLHRLKPEIAMAVSAMACLVRWALLAESTSIVAIAAAEPLHGFTFALLHLSCMRVLATIVPRELAGLAQAIYGTVGVGLTSAVLHALLRFALYRIWCPGLLGNVSNSFVRAARHLATLPSTHMTDLLAHRCADRIARGGRLHGLS